MHIRLVAALLGVFLLLGAQSRAAVAGVSTGEDDPLVRSYTIDASHSSISFKVRHLGLANVTGSFHSYGVQLAMNPNDLSSLRADAVIRVESIDTGNEKRDAHLRSADFFDTETFETIRFASREIRNINGSDFEVVGDITIRDVTREIVLDGQLLGTAVGPMGENRVGLQASGEISRKDFGLTWNQLTEAGGIIVGDTVRLILEVQAIES